MQITLSEAAEEAEIDQEDLEAVCTLKAIGIKLALVTMRGSTEKALKKIGLKDIFDVVVTRDDEPTNSKDVQRLVAWS